MTLTNSIEAQAREFLDRTDDAQAPAADYAQVEAALTLVKDSAQRVLEADAQGAQQALATISREYPAMQTLVGYLVADGERALRADLAQALEQLQAVADERLRPHATAPERLEAHRDEVLAQCGPLADLVPQTREAAAAPDWLGPASEAYRASATVQASALDEFAGMVRRSAESLNGAALLHRATFYLCAETLRSAARQIDVLVAGDPGHLFARSRQVISLVNRAASNLGHDVDAARRGQPATELADGMDAILRTAQVLTDPTWPNGG